MERLNKDIEQARKLYYRYNNAEFAAILSALLTAIANFVTIGLGVTATWVHIGLLAVTALMFILGAFFSAKSSKYFRRMIKLTDLRFALEWDEIKKS